MFTGNIYPEIEIEAGPERVWETIVDFNTYPDWNPFVRKISGSLKEGTRLKVSLQPPKGKEMTFSPKLHHIEKNKEFSWLGHLLIPGLFDGEHVYRIESLGQDRSRFIHKEDFSGFLVPFLGSLLKDTEQAFAGMNKALKQRVESRKENIKPT